MSAARKLAEQTLARRAHAAGLRVTPHEQREFGIDNRVPDDRYTRQDGAWR